MKKAILFFCTLSLSAMFLASCSKEDEGEELRLSFKTGGSYVSADTTIADGTTILIGVEGETEKAKDPIIKFNITESVNGALGSTIYTEDLEDTEYEYDLSYTLDDATSGNTHDLTFTITNRDGLNDQVSLTVTVQ